MRTETYTTHKTQLNTSHIVIVGLQTFVLVLSLSLCCFRTWCSSCPDLSLLIWSLFAPPNPSEVQTISTRVIQSKHTRPVLVSSSFRSHLWLFRFLVGVGCLVLVSLVVLCLCRQVFSHGFDFLPSSWPNSTSNVLTSLLHTPSTHMGPPLGNLSPQPSTPTPIKSCGGYEFLFPLLHEKTLSTYIIPLVVFPYPLLPPPPTIALPFSSVVDIFWGPTLKSCVPFIPVYGLSHVALLDPVCVVCSQTGAARAKCQAPSCCLHLPQWPAQCPSLCPTLNPTARPLTADSPRPHLRVSDPHRDRSEKAHQETTETKQREAIWKSPPCPVKRPLPFFFQHRTTVNGKSPLCKTPSEGYQMKQSLLCEAGQRKFQVICLRSSSFGVHQGCVSDPFWFVWLQVVKPLLCVQVCKRHHQPHLFLVLCGSQSWLITFIAYLQI